MSDDDDYDSYRLSDDDNASIELKLDHIKCLCHAVGGLFLRSYPRDPIQTLFDCLLGVIPADLDLLLLPSVAGRFVRSIVCILPYQVPNQP